MPVYLAEFYLPGATSAEAVSLAGRVQHAATAGREIRFVRAVSVPAQDFCLCLFEATDAEAVRAAVTAAGLVLAAAPEQVELVEGLTRLGLRTGSADTRPREESR